MYKSNIYNNLNNDGDDILDNVSNNLFEKSNNLFEKSDEKSDTSDTLSENLSEKKYMEPTIIQNINLDKYFTKEDIDKSILNNKKLMITDKGLYSISKYQDALWISEIIKKFLKWDNINISTISIIDATAGVGGNTISFSKYFSKVYAIEINNTHYNVLNNNLEALSIHNVKIYNDNFLNIINDNNCIIKSDIFFLDPPWGGKSYKNFKYFNLKIGKLPIYTIINLLFEKKFKYVVLKAPYNLNLSPIYANIKYENLNVYSNYKKNMILCCFY